MSPKMLYANDKKCVGVTSGVTGNSYNADRQGFIHVDDRDVSSLLKSGDVIMAGGMPKVGKYFLCECGWEASINSCPKCKRHDLTKIEK